MITFDIFDTLIGRWYKEPDSIFKEIEEETGLQHFVFYRKHNERLSHLKTLDDIYAQPWPDGFDPEFLKKLEFKKELERVFPIVENVDKLNGATLLSDTYFSKQQLEKLLEVCGIDNYSDIICGYALKSSGSIWRELKNVVTEHTGDNEESDYKNPLAYGIKANLYTGSNFSENEAWTDSHGYPYLARLMRMMRLTSTNQVAIEQSQSNLALLVLLSNWLKDQDVDKLLFTIRDCFYLSKIYKIRFGDDKSILFPTSRVLYNNPSDEFKEFCKNVYTDKSLIVDLQGTGQTCNSFFKTLGIDPNYFTVVDSNLSIPNYKINYLFKRTEGYTDNIERLNYIPYSSCETFPENPKFIDNLPVQRIYLFWLAVNKALLDGFKLETSFNYSLMKDFMNYIEKNCYIKTIVNHEEI